MALFLEPLPLHSSSSSWYLAHFLLVGLLYALFPRTVSSLALTLASEVMIISGQSEVVVMCYGNVSHFPGSACSCQSAAVWRRPVADSALAWGFCPALMKQSAFLGGR